MLLSELFKYDSSMTGNQNRAVKTNYELSTNNTSHMQAGQKTDIPIPARVEADISITERPLFSELCFVNDHIHDHGFT